MTDTLVEGLFKFGSRFLGRRGIEAIIAFLSLHLTAMFIEIAGSLDGSHALLYWICALVAMVTALIGLVVLGSYTFRTLSTRRIVPTGDNPSHE